MDRKRRLALIFATIGIALGAGQIVQTGAGSIPQVATAALTPTQITQVSAGPENSVPEKLVVVAPQIVAVLEPKPIMTAALTDPIAPEPLPLPEPVADACPVTLDLLVEPNAMIGLTLVAPCAPDTSVVLRHAGLAITAKTSVTGSLFMSLPALEMQADVTATLKGEPAVKASIVVPELATLRRFGVQWQSDDAFQLHAFESGVDFGGPGHVSAVDPHMPKAAEMPTGGYMTLLGDDQVSLPMLAEVYTFPATGAPEVVVEAAVTAKTCGRELLAETLTSTGGKVVTMDLTLAMPDCTAIGDILVLNNLVSDPTMVATN